MAGSRRIVFTSCYTHKQWDYIKQLAEERESTKSKVIQELIDLGIQKLQE